MMKENPPRVIVKEAEENTPETKEIREWPEEDFGLLLGDLEILKKTEKMKEDPEGYVARSVEVFNEIDSLLQDYGGELREDVNDIYREYNSSSPLIVRREDPARLLNLVRGGEIEMTFDKEVVGDRGDKYANAALWPYGPTDKTSGIANAFLEGRGAAGPVVLLAGYKQDGGHMKIEEPENKMMHVGTIDRHAVKILSGKLEREDLAFIIVRAPRKFFDQSKIKPEEGQQIFRGYSFT